MKSSKTKPFQAWSNAALLLFSIMLFTVVLFVIFSRAEAHQTQASLSSDLFLSVAISILGGLLGFLFSYLVAKLKRRDMLGKIFISHTSKDKSIAEKLIHDLEHAGYNIFDPETMILAGENIGGKIDTSIAKSDFLVVLLSKDSVSSKWVYREIESALKHGIKIVPVVIQDEIDIPDMLRDIKHITMNERFYDKAYDELKNALSALRNVHEPQMA